eukprot:CAMPEP_0197716024 /NCGR_PEP_ID=MMETSP1434-20131217/1066_1 /TAXON_ID=265543 /ORGANISM="Minutocellus polymorphus, Strain CCMP3303" /LENGTH=369 /DNA_ID=CAMNT_0043300323 /DNA_START=494 /DNA_END=1603 /DNA_ORIENTATION=-
MTFVHKRIFIAILLVMNRSKLTTSQAFTSVQKPAHLPSIPRKGHTERVRLAQTTSSEGGISEESAKELGRFYKVRPKWEGSSYSYARPSKRSRNVKDTKEENVGGDINTTGSYDANESGRQRYELDFPNCGKVGLRLNSSLVADHGVSGTGHTLWSAALAISSYLDSQLENDGIASDGSMYAPTFDNRKIESCLELGAGLGLPSIVAARHGVPRIIVTDTDEEPDVMKSLEESMRHNLNEEQFANQVSVEALDWRHPRDDLMQQFGTLDLIIASDVIWNATRPSWPGLFSILDRLRHNCYKSEDTAEHRDPLLLMGYTLRRLDMTVQEEQEFFDLVRKSGMQAKPMPSASSDNWPLTVIYELSWVGSKT